MEANSSSKVSFAWRSIIQTTWVVELGSIWRVGDGMSIKIRGDKCGMAGTCKFGFLLAKVFIPLVVLIDYYLQQKDCLSLTVLTLVDVSICGMAFGLYKFLAKSNTYCGR